MNRRTRHRLIFPRRGVALLDSEDIESQVGSIVLTTRRVIQFQASNGSDLKACFIRDVDSVRLQTEPRGVFLLVISGFFLAGAGAAIAAGIALHAPYLGLFMALLALAACFAMLHAYSGSGATRIGFRTVGGLEISHELRGVSEDSLDGLVNLFCELKSGQ